MRRTIYPRFHPALAMAGLLLVVVWLYTPTLGFGFFWDDPLWFGRIVGKSLGELIQPTPDYQFYRPGVMLYYRLFMRNDNTFAAPLLPQSLPSGRLAIQVGIYDRVTGERLPATTPQGEPLPGNSFIVGYLP